VFTRTKHRAARLAKALRRDGIQSDEIHGNRSQNQRQNALKRFRSGSVQVLVGTDVAARGIDVDDITHVINYEIPGEAETYVHRIGRTARAGTGGAAMSMCDTEELGDFRRIEDLLKQRVEVDRRHPYHKEPASRSHGRSQRRRGGRGQRR
jgi:ATP-dependent RNA helicase RhlE